MEPVDSGPLGGAFGPPSGGAMMATPTTPGTRRAVAPVADMMLMVPWRVGGAVALSLSFVLIGWQVQRLVVGDVWSDMIMWWSIVAGLLAAVCVLGWTWAATTNARRLVEPATPATLPDPVRAVTAWLVPFAFVAASVVIVAYLGVQASSAAGESVSSIPLAVAVIALLLAIPMTYRPLHYLSGAVRQVGGHSASLSQWMWVPVVLAVVGIASIVALRLGGVVGDTGGAIDDATQWAPLWLVGVVAIAPCVVVVLLAWRAATSVEEALLLAVDRRRRATGARTSRRVAHSKSARGNASAVAERKRVRLIPGDDLLRLAMVTMLAGMALLTFVASAVMFLFWLESNDGVLLPSQRARAWDAFGVLQSGARVVGFALIGLTSIWTFVAVSNVRLASGRRRNPLIAAAAWPCAAIAFWFLADRLVVDQSAASIVVGFALQAAVLFVPFMLLERSADAVEARRTPIRITYMVGVVLLVYVQALGGMSTVEQSSVTTQFGRVAGFLALGALLQLLSTLAVTEACRVIEIATERDAEAHNTLVDQREAVAARGAVAPPPAFVPQPVLVPQPAFEAPVPADAVSTPAPSVESAGRSRSEHP